MNVQLSFDVVHLDVQLGYLHPQTHTRTCRHYTPTQSLTTHARRRRLVATVGLHQQSCRKFSWHTQPSNTFNVTVISEVLDITWGLRKKTNSFVFLKLTHNLATVFSDGNDFCLSGYIGVGLNNRSTVQLSETSEIDIRNIAINPRTSLSLWTIILLLMQCVIHSKNQL